MRNPLAFVLLLGCTACGEVAHDIEAVVEYMVPVDGCDGAIRIGDETFGATPESRPRVEAVVSGTFGRTPVILTYRHTDTAVELNCGWSPATVPAIEVLEIQLRGP